MVFNKIAFFINVFFGVVETSIDSLFKVDFFAGLLLLVGVLLLVVIVVVVLLLLLFFGDGERFGIKLLCCNVHNGLVDLGFILFSSFDVMAVVKFAFVD